MDNRRDGVARFRSYIPTSPHPDYVSGHSTFSAASAQVLRSFAGSDTLNLTVAFETNAWNKAQTYFLGIAAG